MKGAVLLASLLLVALGAAPAEKTITIVLAGDSTVTDKAGWGVGFAALLADDVVLLNHARGGRSSRTFREEGSWEKVLATKADYVLIQFGHNDEPGTAARPTVRRSSRGSCGCMSRNIARRGDQADPPYTACAAAVQGGRQDRLIACAPCPDRSPLRRK